MAVYLAATVAGASLGLAAALLFGLVSPVGSSGFPAAVAAAVVAGGVLWGLYRLVPGWEWRPGGEPGRGRWSVVLCAALAAFCALYGGFSPLHFVPALTVSLVLALAVALRNPLLELAAVLVASLYALVATLLALAGAI